MSPDISDKPFLTSWRKPDETETAMIITRKLTAIEITAIFPLKRSLPAMKNDASISGLIILCHHGLILLLQLCILHMLCCKKRILNCRHIAGMLLQDLIIIF